MTDRRFGLAACALSIFLLFSAMFAGGRAYSATGGAPQVSAAIIRLPMVAGRPGAGYFIMKGSAQPDQLIGVSSPAAQRVEIHRSTMADGIARMEAVGAVDLPAGHSVQFAPGGYHLMLFGLKADTLTVPLALKFASGRIVNVKARAEAMTGMGHDHH